MQDQGQGERLGRQHRDRESVHGDVDFLNFLNVMLTFANALCAF